MMPAPMRTSIARPHARVDFFRGMAAIFSLIKQYFGQVNRDLYAKEHGFDKL
jgi:hypothetical protein